MTAQRHARDVHHARTLVSAYLETAAGAGASKPMRARLCSVVRSMPHLFTSIEHVQVLHVSCEDVDALGYAR